MHYQHDGASAHFCRDARQILNDHLAGRWIGRRGPMDWPARSPPCDYWLWPHLKALVFETQRHYNSLRDLEEAINEKIEPIQLSVFRNAMRNFQRRVTSCIQANGNLF